MSKENTISSILTDHISSLTRSLALIDNARYLPLQMSLSKELDTIILLMTKTRDNIQKVEELIGVKTPPDTVDKFYDEMIISKVNRIYQEHQYAKDKKIQDMIIDNRADDVI